MRAKPDLDGSSRLFDLIAPIYGRTSVFNIKIIYNLSAPALKRDSRRWPLHFGHRLPRGSHRGSGSDQVLSASGMIACNQYQT